MSGTARVYRASAQRAICPRTCYGMSGTETAYRAQSTAGSSRSSRGVGGRCELSYPPMSLLRNARY
eukprot:750373-Rhodomonas_salina.3